MSDSPVARGSGRQRAEDLGQWFGPLAAAVLAGVLLWSLDLLGYEFWSQHPMLGQAVGGAFLFVQGGLLLPRFLGYQEEKRRREVSQVAYAALAQSVNDAGRRLLAPLNGADLYALGIDERDRPAGAPRPTVVENRERLTALGFGDHAAEVGGQWSGHEQLARARLPKLLAHRGFASQLFRIVSRVRRDMQASAGEWMPTMLGDKQRTNDLDAFREVIWRCHDLQRRLRECPAILDPDADWTPATEWITGVTEAYVTVIVDYERVRGRLNDGGVKEPGPVRP